MVYFINIQHQLSHCVWQALSEIGHFDVSEDMSKVMSELFAVTDSFIAHQEEDAALSQGLGRGRAGQKSSVPKMVCDVLLELSVSTYKHVHFI